MGSKTLRRVVTIGFGVVCATAVVGGSTANATGESAAAWRFAGIGSSQKTLRLLVDRGPCFATATQNVGETATAVGVGFLAGPAPESGCRPPQFETVLVTLKSPLRGRSLIGAAGRDTRTPALPTVPHVVGLKPGDAVTVLQESGYTAKVVRRRDAPGRPRVLTQAGTRLVLSR